MNVHYGIDRTHTSWCMHLVVCPRLKRMILENYARMWPYPPKRRVVHFRFVQKVLKMPLPCFSHYMRLWHCQVSCEKHPACFSFFFLWSPVFCIFWRVEVFKIQRIVDNWVRCPDPEELRLANLLFPKKFYTGTLLESFNWPLGSRGLISYLESLCCGSSATFQKKVNWAYGTGVLTNVDLYEICRLIKFM